MNAGSKHENVLMFRNMKLEGNLGDSYHRMRKLTAPGREDDQQNTNNRLEKRQLKLANLELANNISWGASSE